MYIAFAFYNYYPTGGMSDLFGVYASIEAAKEALSHSDYDTYQICAGTEIVSSGNVNSLC